MVSPQQLTFVNKSLRGCTQHMCDSCAIDKWKHECRGIGNCSMCNSKCFLIAQFRARQTSPTGCFVNDNAGYSPFPMVWGTCLECSEKTDSSYLRLSIECAFNKKAGELKQEREDALKINSNLKDALFEKIRLYPGDSDVNLRDQLEASKLLLDSANRCLELGTRIESLRGPAGEKRRREPEPEEDDNPDKRPKVDV